MIHLYEPMTDYLEMQCKQLCVIAVTDIPIFKSRSHPPKTQIGLVTVIKCFQRDHLVLGASSSKRVVIFVYVLAPWAIGGWAFWLLV